MPTVHEDSEDEWEYEYDHNESEVFLVDLDLTTVNRTIRTTSAHRGKRTLDKPDSFKAKRQKTGKQADKSAEGGLQDPVNPGNQEASQEAPNGNGTTKRDGLQDNASNVSDENESQDQSLQLLDLHTGNPIVSYQGNIFSCSWTDMIGTTMFFSDHRDTPLYDPELVTDELDMMGTSRIKLVGHLAKTTPIKQPVQGDEPGSSTAIDVDSGVSLGGIRSSNAKRNADLRKQANFLEQLMNVKKNRGEEDNVRIVMNSKIAAVEAAGKLHLNTQRRGEEIEELNKKVVNLFLSTYPEIPRVSPSAKMADSEPPSTPMTPSPWNAGPRLANHVITPILDLRSSTKVGENPTFAETVSNEEKILGDKAVGGMDNDADHVPNVESGLKAAISNPNTSEKGRKEAEAKLRTLESTS